MRGIHRLGERADDHERLFGVDRGRGAVSRGARLEARVERRDVAVRHYQIGGVALDAGGDEFDQPAMTRQGLDDGLECFGDLLRLFGRRVDLEHLHRDKLIAHRVLRPVDGTKDTDTNLMQDPKRAE